MSDLDVYQGAIIYYRVTHDGISFALPINQTGLTPDQVARLQAQPPRLIGETIRSDEMDRPTQTRFLALGAIIQVA